MNIVQVTNSYKPAWQMGGVCRVAYDISTELQNRNQNVRVLTTNYGSESEVTINKWVDVDGVDVIYYKNWAPISVIGKIPIPTFPIYRGMDAILDADVVHLHDYRSFLSIMASRLCKRHNIPYIIQMHGALSYSIGKGSQKIAFDKLFGRDLIAGASKIITLTSTEADILSNLGIPDEKMVTIPNGVNLTNYNDLPAPKSFRNVVGIPDDNIILYLGRLDPTKGIDMLLLAFAACRKIRSDTQLVVIGPDDGERSRLERLARNLEIERYVKFIGYVSHTTKLAALIDSDMLVCPCYNGFPITFLEACACGRPIVTTTKGDQLDWLNGKSGIITGYGSDELKTGILSLLKDKNKCSILGDEGRRQVEDEFNIKNITTRLLDLYDNV